MIFTNMGKVTLHKISLRTIYGWILYPIKQFPGEFLFMGILLFVPEVVTNAFGAIYDGGGYLHLFDCVSNT